MIRPFIFGIGLSMGLAAPAFAEPAMTGAPVTMRAAPSGRAAFVQHIPANAQIDLSNCDRGWCYASWRNLFGWIPADVVVVGPPPAVAPPPVVVAPAWGWGWGHPYGWGGPYVGGGWGYGWRRW